MASLIEGMFSDSDAFRQKRISDLQEQSERRKQMSLLNQVAAGRGAQIAEGIGGMFGLKTAEERKAIAEQQALKNTTAKTGTPEYFIELANAMQEIDPEKALKLREHASSLVAASKEAARKQTESDQKTAEHGWKANKLENILGVNVKDSTLESQAKAKTILMEGRTKDGIYPNDVKQAALSALKTQDKRSVTNINTKGESEFSKKLGKNDADAYTDSLASAQASNDAIIGGNKALDLLDQGIITGTGSSLILPTVEAFQRLGLVGQEAVDEVARTRQYLQATGTQAVKDLSSGMYGSGQSMTDADRENAQRLAAGDINIPEEGLRRLLAFNQQVAIEKVQKHNQEVERLNARYKDQNLPKQYYVGQRAKLSDGSTYQYLGGGKWKKL